MKRSEVLNRLAKVLKAEKAYPYRAPEEVAKDLLLVIEDAGMLPPKRIRYPKLKYNVGYGDQAPPVSCDIFEWEPEDD